MIRILILCLMELFNNNPKPKKSLHKQQKQIILPTKEVLIIGGLGVLLFVIICLLFMPGTESGLWYNHSHI